jgi:hypothetical protein
MKRMLGSVLAGCLLAPCVLWAAPKTADGRTRTVVSCDKGDTIGGALSRLSRVGPNTVEVYGACTENVTIERFHDLWIIGRQATLQPAVTTSGSYTLQVKSSQLVRIETLTIHGGGIGGVLLDGCSSCELSGSEIDGDGHALVAVSGTSAAVRDCGLRVNSSGIGAGAWWAATLDFQNTVIDGGSTGWPSPWSGVMVGAQGSINVRMASVIKGFSVGAAVSADGVIQLNDTATIQDNYQRGVVVESAGRLWVAGTIRNNGALWSGGGVLVEPGGWVGLYTGEVSGNVGGGVRLVGKALASLRRGIVVTGNIGPGIAALNDSMVSGPAQGTATVSGNQGADLYCDSTSQIIRAAAITGTPQVRDCPMIKDGE